MYPDCARLIAAGAFARLRPQAAAPQVRPAPLAAWPDVPADYIVCTADRMVSPAWGARRRGARLPVRELPAATRRCSPARPSWRRCCSGTARRLHRADLDAPRRRVSPSRDLPTV